MSTKVLLAIFFAVWSVWKNMSEVCFAARTLYFSAAHTVAVIADKLDCIFTYRISE